VLLYSSPKAGLNAVLRIREGQIAKQQQFVRPCEAKRAVTVFKLSRLCRIRQFTLFIESIANCEFCLSHGVFTKV